MPSGLRRPLLKEDNVLSMEKVWDLQLARLGRAKTDLGAVGAESIAALRKTLEIYPGDIDFGSGKRRAVAVAAVRLVILHR